MSLLDKVLSNSKAVKATMLEDSVVFEQGSVYPTDLCALNIALSGAVDGGLTKGLTFIAGESKHFKTLFGLLSVKAFLDSDPEAVCVFIDTEFGAPKDYWDSVGVDSSRVVHIECTNLEIMKQVVAQQLEALEKNDKVIFFIDSVGNVASKKEAQDAIDGNAKADMTRAKEMKSLFRIATPLLTTKNIPMVAINHTYKTQEMFAKDVMSGGCVMAGTKIKMANGTLENIEDISVDDMVITHDGTAQRVQHTWNPETLEVGTPETYEVEFEDGRTVICSENHRFMTEDGWKYITELSIGNTLSTV